MDTSQEGYCFIMNSNIIEKALILGEKLSTLTSNDGKERSIFFTEESESIMGVGTEEIIIFCDTKEKKELEAYVDNNKKRDDLSHMHSHALDATFSVGDIQSVKGDWDENKINYQFVITSKHLFSIFIPPDLKYGLNLSKLLIGEYGKMDMSIWKRVGVKKFKEKDLGKGKKCINIPDCSDEQKIQHNRIWNEEFEKFFKRWNYINNNQLEYVVVQRKNR